LKQAFEGGSYFFKEPKVLRPTVVDAVVESSIITLTEVPPACDHLSSPFELLGSEFVWVACEFALARCMNFIFIKLEEGPVEADP
jgi:hypothetical protein